MKKSKTTFERIKKGSRIKGVVCTLDDGRQAFIAFKRNKDIATMGKRNLKEALETKSAAWGIEITLLQEMSRRGIEYIGVKVRDSGDLYLTSMRLYKDSKLAKLTNGRKVTKVHQRFLPLRYFSHRPGMNLR